MVSVPFFCCLPESAAAFGSNNDSSRDDDTVNFLRHLQAGKADASKMIPDNKDNKSILVQDDRQTFASKGPANDNH